MPSTATITSDSSCVTAGTRELSPEEPKVPKQKHSTLIQTRLQLADRERRSPPMVLMMEEKSGGWVWGGYEEWEMGVGSYEEWGMGVGELLPEGLK